MECRADRASLTRRQHDVLAALASYQAEQGRPPTRAELGGMLGVAAQTADFHLRALARKGFVELGSNSRAIRPLHGSWGSDGSAPAVDGPADAATVPLLGRVAAGAPRAALAHEEARIAVPAGLRADFAVRVEGDSMRDAGILDGDMALVRRDPQPRTGATVVALVGEGEAVEATVKRLQRADGRMILRAAHPDHADQVYRPGDAVRLAGRVVGILRTEVD